jgi:hypothetical protein
MSVIYEWDVEEVSTLPEDQGDIIEHWFQTSYAGCVKKSAEAPQAGAEWKVVLVRDDDEGRSWAYMDDGKLPEHFTDANGADCAKVPQKFHAEVQRSAA